MRRLWILLVSGLVWVSLATTAQGQEGSALYEPFPEPHAEKRAPRFVENLAPAGGAGGRIDVSKDELDVGVLIDPGTGRAEAVEVPASGASARAAGGDGLEPSFGWLVGAILLAAVGTIAVQSARLPGRAA